MVLLLSLSNLRQYRQQLAVLCSLHLNVVHLHAVVEVNSNACKSNMSQHSIIVTAFMQLLLQLLLAFARQRHFTTSAIIHDILHTVDFAFVGFFHLAKIFCTHLAGGVGVIAVHIDKSLKTVLLAAVIEPINRTLLVNLAVILEEVLQEVVADFLTRRITRCAKCICNEAQVFFQRFCAVNNLQPGNQTTYDIILK